MNDKMATMKLFGNRKKITTLDSCLLYRAFVNTRLLVHKHVKISVDEWILETTHPQKHVKFLEQRKDYLTSYESQKRKQGVLLHWKIDRPWLRLETNEEQDIMFCDYCINAGISSDISMFAKGCSSIRLESIKYHKGSNQHVLALSKHINKMKPTDAPRAFVNTRLLVHKHVKISVDEWILETTHPQKHVKFLERRKDYLTSYESQKRKQGVLLHWKIDRPWLRLETNEEQDIMFCDYCINAGISSDISMFAKGFSSIRLESIKYHKGSNQHVLALSKHINKMKPTDTPAAKAYHSLNKALFPKLQHLFRTVHALNIKARQYQDYAWVNELDE